MEFLAYRILYLVHTRNRSGKPNRDDGITAFLLIALAMQTSMPFLHHSLPNSEKTKLSSMLWTFGAP